MVEIREACAAIIRLPSRVSRWKVTTLMNLPIHRPPV